jgi:hypothetical protein
VCYNAFQHKNLRNSKTQEKINNIHGAIQQTQREIGLATKTQDTTSVTNKYNNKYN